MTRPARPTLAARIAPCLSLLAGLAVALPEAHAEKADRAMPVNLEADRMTLDDARKTSVFEGHVVLTQGTLVIRGDKMVVTQDPGGFQKGVVTGAPARFRQKRDGQEGYVDGEALRIEYDAHADKAEFYDKAWIRSGGDELRGPYISYDGKTETYVASGSASGPGIASGRVKAVIQPKNKDEPERPAATPSGRPAP